MKKNATHSRKQVLDLDLADHVRIGAEDISVPVGADDGHDLAQLAYKYFGEEISEALREVQEALTAEKSCSSLQAKSAK